MMLETLPEKIPLEIDDDGVVRVGGTRVTLDSVVASYDEGSSPEEIVQDYPSLTLADVYSAIAYLLSHETEVRSYLYQRPWTLTRAEGIPKRRER